MAYAVPVAMVASSLISGMMGKSAAKKAAKASASGPMYVPETRVDPKTGKEYRFMRFVGNGGGQTTNLSAMNPLGRALDAGVDSWASDYAARQRNNQAQITNAVNAGINTNYRTDGLH